MFRFLLRIPSSLYIILLLLITGCDKVPEYSPPEVIKQDAPSMSAKNIDILFSDSGKVEARLISQLLNRYGGESPYVELPEGFIIYVYDSLQRVASTITGKKGVRRDYARVMEAWGNVVVRNELKNEQLATEHLVWDENRRRIWSDVKVTITRPGQVITGTSIESNDTFTRYTITNMSGEMVVSNDSI